MHGWKMQKNLLGFGKESHMGRDLFVSSCSSLFLFILPQRSRVQASLYSTLKVYSTVTVYSTVFVKNKHKNNNKKIECVF